MKSETIPCPLCGCDAKREEDRKVYWISECQCAKYAITRHDFNNRSEDLAADGYKLAALAREQLLKKCPPYFLQFDRSQYYPDCPDTHPVCADDLLRQWPRTVTERLNRALRNLVRLSEYFGAYIREPARDHTTALFVRESNEATGVLTGLSELRYIERHEMRARGEFGSYRVTAAGWHKVEELQQPSAENPVFVATWFGDKGRPETVKRMQAVYDSIRAGIWAAGYYCGDRIDQTDFTGAIMDRVVAAIREAPFIVADFTEQRGGVYYEAGLAPDILT